MKRCPKCSINNENRNYYCDWCGRKINPRAATGKNIYKRFDHLLHLPMLESLEYQIAHDERPIDRYQAYGSREKRKK